MGSRLGMEYISVKEASGLLGVCHQTVRRLVARGIIDSQKSGKSPNRKIVRATFEAWCSAPLRPRHRFGDFMTQREAAAKLGVTLPLVKRWVDSGRIEVEAYHSAKSGRPMRKILRSTFEAMMATDARPRKRGNYSVKQEYFKLIRKGNAL